MSTDSTENSFELFEDIFELPDWNIPSRTGPPKVRFAKGLSEAGLTKERVMDFTAFHDWITVLQKSLQRQHDPKADHTFANDPYFLRWINIEAFNDFGTKEKPNLLFMKIFAQVTTDHGEYLPGVVFLRGGSVAVLMILRPQDAPLERYVIMVEQARIAAGSLQFMEIPAGMIDKEKNFKIAAVKEIQEEIGLVPKANELVNMTSLAVDGAPVQEGIQDAMYPSPGGCDEFINIFLWEKEMDRLDIEGLKGKLMGERAEAERITVRLLEYEKLVSVGARDGKTLAAWSLYEYLKRIHPEALLQDK